VSDVRPSWAVERLTSGRRRSWRSAPHLAGVVAFAGARVSIDV
jgi:hypothetical protein